eukprot:GILK01011203.1.p1 GENE.GILK01011203.1~~GILK01011203.1.p1  ORF type:complete len:1080 (+),score=147.45 GILK01011203.1:161-3241(+)
MSSVVPTDPNAFHVVESRTRKSPLMTPEVPSLLMPSLSPLLLPGNVTPQLGIPSSSNPFSALSELGPEQPSFSTNFSSLSISLQDVPNASRTTRRTRKDVGAASPSVSPSVPPTAPSDVSIEPFFEMKLDVGNSQQLLVSQRYSRFLKNELRNSLFVMGADCETADSTESKAVFYIKDRFCSDNPPDELVLKAFKPSSTTLEQLSKYLSATFPLSLKDIHLWDRFASENPTHELVLKTFKDLNTTVGFKEFSKTVPLSLKHLQLCDVSVDSYLSSFAQTHLQSFHMTSVPLSLEGTQVIRDALLHPLCAWKTLTLSGCHLGTEGIQVLVEGLRECSSLTYLDLSSNEIGTEGMKALASAFPEHDDPLWTFNSAQSAPPISTKLNLVSLILRNDFSIDFEGYVAVARRLQYAQSLQEVDFSNQAPPSLALVWMLEYFQTPRYLNGTRRLVKPFPTLIISNNMDAPKASPETSRMNIGMLERWMHYFSSCDARAMRAEFLVHAHGWLTSLRLDISNDDITSDVPLIENLGSLLTQTPDLSGRDQPLKSLSVYITLDGESAAETKYLENLFDVICSNKTLTALEVKLRYTKTPSSPHATLVQKLTQILDVHPTLKRLTVERTVGGHTEQWNVPEDISKQFVESLRRNTTLKSLSMALLGTLDTVPFLTDVLRAFTPLLVPVSESAHEAATDVNSTHTVSFNKSIRSLSIRYAFSALIQIDYSNLVEAVGNILIHNSYLEELSLPQMSYPCLRTDWPVVSDCPANRHIVISWSKYSSTSCLVNVERLFSGAFSAAAVNGVELSYHAALILRMYLPFVPVNRLDFESLAIIDFETFQVVAEAFRANAQQKSMHHLSIHLGYSFVSRKFSQLLESLLRTVRSLKTCVVVLDEMHFGPHYRTEAVNSLLSTVRNSTVRTRENRYVSNHLDKFTIKFYGPTPVPAEVEVSHRPLSPEVKYAYLSLSMHDNPFKLLRGRQHAWGHIFSFCSQPLELIQVTTQPPTHFEDELKKNSKSTAVSWLPRTSIMIDLDES